MCKCSVCCAMASPLLLPEAFVMMHLDVTCGADQAAPLIQSGRGIDLVKKREKFCFHTNPLGSRDDYWKKNCQWDFRKIYISKFASVWQWSFSNGSHRKQNVVVCFAVEANLEEHPDSHSMGTQRIQNNLRGTN